MLLKSRTRAPRGAQSQLSPSKTTTAILQSPGVLDRLSPLLWGWAARNPPQSFCHNETLASCLWLLPQREANLRLSKVCEIGGARSDQWFFLKLFITRYAPSFLSSSLLLHFLPSYPTQASTNPFKSVWSIVQNKDSIEGEKRQGHSGFSSRGWIPLNYCISKLVQRASGEQDVCIKGKLW